MSRFESNHFSSNNPYAADQSPDLSLAQTPDVASGSSIAAMPVPLPAIPREQPMLQSADPGQDIAQMGIVDSVSYYDLNLAGTRPLPKPPYTAPAGNALNAPTFGTQNYEIPATRPYDLQGPGIDLVKELQADPQVGDLLQFDAPHGLDIMAASSQPLAKDLMAPDLSLYDRPENLLVPEPMMVDPLLPDLQHPQGEQQVNSMVDDRPAELSPSALNILRSSPTYTQIPSNDFEHLWMTQTGNNAARERHMGMLMYGLEREEGAQDEHAK